MPGLNLKQKKYFQEKKQKFKTMSFEESLKDKGQKLFEVVKCNNQ